MHAMFHVHVHVDLLITLYSRLPKTHFRHFLGIILQREVTHVKGELISKSTTVERLKADNVRLKQHLTDTQQRIIQVSLQSCSLRKLHRSILS